MRHSMLAGLLLLTAGCAGIKDRDHSQAGWRLKSDTVDLFVTENGGHMAPVRFCADTAKPVQPYYISPWQNDGLKNLPAPVLVPFRGDFFAMPFGGNGEVVNGEKHTGHGEPASSKWRFVGETRQDGVATLTLALETQVRKGKITKKIHLADGHNVVYTTHVLEGYSGAMPLGHHSMLAAPETDGGLRIAVSKFDLGMTCPTVFSNPANRAYQSLAVNKTFTDLASVPALARDAQPADCSSYPRREGFDDLIQLFKKPSAEPAWTAATCQEEGYLWFSLKDASLMPGTIFWITNGGSNGFPWNGSNRCLGLEENCAYFAEGLGPSTRPNIITKQGFPTAVALSPTKPTTVNFIQGAVKVPAGFECVKTARFADGSATFVSITGKEVTVEVNHAFLKTGRPR
ncbi:hypothetical protein HQ560_18655 [bacterium]|nr:hypothetical protein [bacterium]